MKQKWIILALIVLAYLWFPTGDPSDLLTFGMIAKIGMSQYIFWSIIILIVAYLIIPGDGIKGKFNRVRGSF
jgi:hypothetical protein